MSQQLELSLPPPNPPLPTLPDLWTPDDIYSVLDADLLRKFNEDRRLERKTARTEPKVMGEYLSMWANTSPDGGIVILGMEDDGTLTGCLQLSDTQKIAVDLVPSRFCPDSRSESKRVEIISIHGNRDFIIAIRVYYRADKLVETTSGEAFIRIGDEKHRLTAEEKRELRIGKGEIEYEKEPVPLSYPSDFDNLLIRELCDQYRAKRNLTQPHGREDILCLMHLGKMVADRFQPNLACAMLFAGEPRSIVPGARIRFMRFEGHSEGTGRTLTQVKDEYADGPIPVQIQRAEQIITSQIRNFTRLGADGRFYTQPEYPNDVWLEALVNAVSHRSYSLKNMMIYVRMFDDRLVVESPGGFPPPTNPRNIYQIHNPRNPRIMDALYYLDYVHCAHEEPHECGT